jgi:hypothetical protein
MQEGVRLIAQPARRRRRWLIFRCNSGKTAKIACSTRDEAANRE